MTLNPRRAIVASFAAASAGLVATLAAPASADPVKVASPPYHVQPNRGGGGGAPQGLSPTQVRHAYGLDTLPTYRGAGQTIAIIDAYLTPNMPSDLAVFCNQFGLPPANLQMVAMPGANRTNSGWAVETTLDVEWSHVIAPDATIMLVQAASASYTDLLAAVDYATSHGASVVSMSWGGNESAGQTSYDVHFQVPGVTFFAASGDSGSGTIWPSTSPNVVAVGGTHLAVDASGNVLNETAWTGSGGGLSSVYAAPGYQSGLGFSMRAVPDVSYNADPNTGVAVYDSVRNQGQQGWIVVGGTSAGSPQWAALTACVNGQRTTPLGSTLNDLYTNAGTFRDITSGSNGAFTCTPGFDLVTGLGSPRFDQLAPVLIGAAN
jgi:subtilase family serine protease